MKAHFISSQPSKYQSFRLNNSDWIKVVTARKGSGLTVVEGLLFMF